MLRILVLSFLFLVSCFTLSAQQVVHLRGTVIDSKTGTTLPYAHIVIKTKQIATVTERNGAFSLPLQEADLDDSMIVTYVGYKPYSCKLAAFLNRKDSTIKLIINEIQLHQVVITSKQPDVNEIMKKTAAAYQKNKRQSPHVAKGFYREKAKYNNPKNINHYVMFAESIGYAVYNGMDMPHRGYSFFCENTRKCYTREEWRKYALTDASGASFSDVTSSSVAALRVFQQTENYGPISGKFYKTFTYHLDSTYSANNQLYYGLSFLNGSESGSLQVTADNYQVQSIVYQSKAISGRPLNKKVNGDVHIRFIYIKEVPFISSISYHFKADNLEYWNEYQLLIQKFNHFPFNVKEYFSLIWYEMIPFVEYQPKAWASFRIAEDQDYPTISEDLLLDGKLLEEQFISNSGKWWLPDYWKMGTTRDPRDFENQVKLARDLVNRLRRFF